MINILVAIREATGSIRRRSQNNEPCVLTTGTGLPPTFSARWAVFNPFDYKQVHLASGSGVWTCDDISALSPNWYYNSSGLARVDCRDIKYRKSDGALSVATFGRGVFTTASTGLTTSIIVEGSNVVCNNGQYYLENVNSDLTRQ